MAEKGPLNKSPRTSVNSDAFELQAIEEPSAERQTYVAMKSLIAKEITRQILERPAEYKLYQRSCTRGIDPASVLAALQPELRFAAILWRLCERDGLNPNEALASKWPASSRHKLPHHLFALSTVNLLQTDVESMLAYIRGQEGMPNEASRLGLRFLDEIARYEAERGQASFEFEPVTLFSTLNSLGGSMFGWVMSPDFAPEVDRRIASLHLTLGTAVDSARDANPDRLRSRAVFSLYEDPSVPTHSQGPAWRGPYW